MERPTIEPDRRTIDIPGETGEQAELALLQSVGLADSERWPLAEPGRDYIPVFDDGDVNDRPEALEGHEVPYRAEDDLDWPILTIDPKWLPEHGGSHATPPPETDWLERARRARGVVEPGVYDVEILPKDFGLFQTTQTSGVALVVAIRGGEHDGTELRLRFILDGPPPLDPVIRRDLGIVSRWKGGLGIGTVADPVGLVKALGREGKGRRITLGIDTRDGKWGSEIVATSVEVGGLRND